MIAAAKKIDQIATGVSSPEGRGLRFPVRTDDNLDPAEVARSAVLRSARLIYEAVPAERRNAAFLLGESVGSGGKQILSGADFEARCTENSDLVPSLFERMCHAAGETAGERRADSEHSRIYDRLKTTAEFAQRVCQPGGQSRFDPTTWSMMLHSLRDLPHEVAASHETVDQIAARISAPLPSAPASRKSVSELSTKALPSVELPQAQLEEEEHISHRDQRVKGTLRRVLGFAGRAALVTGVSVLIATSIVFGTWPILAVSWGIAGAMWGLSRFLSYRESKSGKRRRSRLARQQGRSGLSATGRKLAFRRPEHRKLDLLAKRRGGAVVDALRGSQAAKNLQASRIRRATPRFYDDMAITDLYVATGPDGLLQRFDSFLLEAECLDPSQQGLFDKWYPKRTLPRLTSDVSDDQLDAELEFQVSAGPASLPLPLGYTAVDMLIYDNQGNEIDWSKRMEVREGMLGSLLVDLPPRTGKVCYTVRKVEKLPSAEMVEQLREVLPDFESYVPDQEAYYRDTISSVSTDQRELAQLDYACLVQSRVTYTDDPFVAALQEQAGPALHEVMSGLRMGKCDGLSYNCLRRFRNLGLAALSACGLVPRAETKDFNIEAAHAQTLAIYGGTHEPSGVEVFDPTVYARGAVSSRDLTWGERAEALLNVDAGTYGDAFGVGEHVSRRLFDDLPKPPEVTGWAGIFLRMWHWGLVPSPGEGNKDEAGHAFQDDYEVTDQRHARANAIRIMAFKRGLDVEIARAVKARSFCRVYDYLKRKVDLPRLAESERRHLPEELWDAIDYEPCQEVVKLSNSVLQSSDFSRRAKSECLDWLLERMMPDFMWPAGWERCTGADDLGDILLEEALAYANPDCLELMHSEQLEKFLTVLTFKGYFLLARDHYREPVDLVLQRLESRPYEQWASSEQLRYCCRALRDTAAALRRRGGRLPDWKAAYLSGLTALQGSAHIHGLNAGKQPAPEGLLREIADQSAQATADLIACADDPCGLLFSHLRESPEGVRAAVCHVGAESVGDMKHRLEERIGRRQLNRGMADELGLELGEQLDPSCDYELLFKNLQQLGFESLKLGQHKGAIEQACLRAARAMQRSKKALLPALASPATPVSSLIVEVSDDERARLCRLAALLASRGIVRLPYLQTHWPASSEEKLASRLEELLELRVNGEEQIVLSGHEHRVGKGVPLVEVPAFMRMQLYKENEQRALDYTEHRGAFQHPMIETIDRVLQYPDAAAYLRKVVMHSTDMEFTRGLFRKLFGQYSDQEMYYAFLWLGAKRVELEAKSDRQIEKTAELLSGLTPVMAANPDVLQRVMEQTLGPDTFCFDNLPAVGSELRAALLMSRTAVWHEYEFREALDREDLQYQLLQPVWLKLTGPASEPVAKMWRNQLGNDPAIDEQVTKSYESTMAYVERSTPLARMLTPYQNYLRSMTGAFHPASKSGEFLEFRHYRSGEDATRIDTKASARTGQQLVRRNQESEVRDYLLVVDLRLLADGRENADGTCDALKDVFRHLVLAEREGVKLDLMLVGRGEIAYYSDLTRPHGDQPTTEYHSRAFRQSLGGHVRHMRNIAVGERVIFGSDGFPAQNVFQGGLSQFPKGRLVIPMLSKHNLKRSMPTLAALRKHGCHVLLPRHQPAAV